jgi:uncharacterized repeat protein (TIGR04138 family)
MIHKQSYDEVLDTILANDSRFHRDAYHFVREGLDYTQQSISKQEEGTVRHISGQELLGGMRAHALEQYGPMALMVLNEWGLTRGEDFGEIVFNMVEHELLAKTEDDTRTDFAGGYTFDEAFRQPFLPPAAPEPELPEVNRTLPPATEAERPANPTSPKASDKQ